MSTQKEPIDLATFRNYLKSRGTPLTAAMAGELVKTSIQGKGIYNPKGHVFPDGTVAMFSKWSYNLKASSALSMARPENKKVLREALVADQAGDTDLATELFNKYLNAIQVKTSSTKQFAEGTPVTVVLATVTNKAGQEQIVANNPAPQVAIVIAPMTVSVDDIVALSLEA